MSEDELDEVRETLVDALLVLANVAQGDCATQLDVDVHGSNPLSFLLGGINDLISTLGTEQEQSLVFRRELDERLTTIEQQRSAIRSLSTPVIEVWRGVLCLPVVGVMDTARSAEMTSALLTTIVEKGSKYAIIDITGVPTVDTLVAQHLLKTVAAARLMGADCIISGIRPQIAQTIVHLGVELQDVVTKATLADAFAIALKRTGMAVVRVGTPQAAAGNLGVVGR